MKSQTQLKYNRSVKGICSRAAGYAKYRSNKKGLEYNIDTQYLISIWPKDNKCPILGTDFKSGLSNKYQLPTLDKIYPKKGYVKGNVAVISFRANQMKSDITDFNIFKKLYEYYKKYI